MQEYSTGASQGIGAAMVQGFVRYERVKSKASDPYRNRIAPHL